MYLCWSVRGKTSREILGTLEETSLFVGNKSEICSPIDLETVMFDGEKLNDIPDGVGVDSEQFTAQQSRAASAAGDFSLLRALSQQSIILRPIFPEFSGMPDSTPPAKAKPRKKDVSQFFVTKLTIFTIRGPVNQYISTCKSHIICPVEVAENSLGRNQKLNASSGFFTTTMDGRLRIGVVDTIGDDELIRGDDR